MADLAFLSAALEEIKAHDLYRQLRPIHGAKSPRTQMEGKKEELGLI